jgi:acyl-coenzyme A synthetase/AMP-(fatty) acid ligase
VVGFVVNYQGSPETMRYRLQERLPGYMVPSAIHVVRELPLNNNGKVDRGAIVKILREGNVPK